MKQLVGSIAIGVLCVSVVAPSAARPPEWLEERMEEIAMIESLPTDQKFEILRPLVRIGVKRDHLDFDDEQRQVFLAAQSALLSIPGHAKWFGDRIRQMTDDQIAGRPNSHHPNQRGWDFQVLGLLPSPESVGVLGELLFDERNPYKGIPSDAPWSPNSANAAYALSGMNIVGRPARGDLRRDPADVRAWQLWFEQVRAGTRTFSFEGDPTIYSLSGPVDRALDPGDVRPRSGAPSPAADPEGSPGPTKAPWIVALSLAVLALILAARRAFPATKRS